MTSYLGFLYHHLTYKPRPLPDSLRLSGKTGLATGSNVGLGLETSKALAAHGASRVVLGVRSVSKGEEVKRAVIAAAASPVVAFAGRAGRELDRGLDVAVLNAGLKRLTYSAPPATGHEAHVRTNHLRTALLSMLLLLPPLLLLEPLRRAGSPDDRRIQRRILRAAGGRRGAPLVVGRPRQHAGAARRPGLLRRGGHARALRALEAAQRALGPRATTSSSSTPSTPATTAAHSTAPIRAPSGWAGISPGPPRTAPGAWRTRRSGTRMRFGSATVRI
ncbi:hypothetical protein DL765_005621 [Monosporascus sp. GIB2]|nr:hypothetical protein DL765_005621 [Monosporascus sp. GIB2]